MPAAGCACFTGRQKKVGDNTNKKVFKLEIEKLVKMTKIQQEVLVFSWHRTKLNNSLLTNQINLFINYDAVLYWLLNRPSQRLQGKSLGKSLSVL